MSIEEFRPDLASLARRRRILGRAVRDALAAAGEDLAGFALVTWNARGDADSAFYTDTGPVGTSLMPTYVHDVLNRHVAVKTAAEHATYQITGGA